MVKKKGFTLAEVLIVLAVIGVIAALTIPTLMAKWREQATVTQVKKAYSVLSQTNDMLIAKNGEDYMLKLLAGTTTGSAAGCKKLADAFAPEFRGTVGYNMTSLLNNVIKLDGSSMSLLQTDSGVALPDGTVMAFYNNSPTCTHNAGSGPLSKTCGEIKLFLQPTKQTQLGINMFAFRLTADGIFPVGWPGDVNPYTSYCNKTSSVTHNGYSCTYWIIKNGNMDYPD